MATQQTIQGRFINVIYSPRGEIEGALLDAGDGPLQLVFEHHDEEAPALFADLRQGQTVVVEAALQGPSPKGEAAHAVYGVGRVKSVDGVKPAKHKVAAAAAYRGRVARFNYARHGEANGVVLDTGDFIHTKPDGMRKLKLKIGDPVAADGDAQMLVTGTGWAVEAVKVNGKPVKPH